MRVIKTTSYEKKAIDRFPDKPVFKEPQDSSDKWEAEIIRDGIEIPITVSYDYEGGDPSTGFAASLELYDAVETGTGRPVTLESQEVEYIRQAIQKGLQEQSQVPDLDESGAGW